MTSEDRAAPQLRTTRTQPERPTLTTANHAPVVAQLPPPVSVRISQLLWILALAVGAFAVAYAFIIREDQLEVISDRVRTVNPNRADETVTTTADILYWSLFGALVAVVLLQLVFLVSFMNRRRRARWWLLATLLLLGAIAVVGVEFVGVGTTADPMRMILLLQAGLAVLALLVGLLPPAIRWTARGIDVRRGPTAAAGPDF